MPKYDADNPLIVGHALHKGIESGMKAMEKDYFESYPIITEAQENEMMKLRIQLPKVQAYIRQFKGCRIEHEVEILAPDFIGFADLIITAPDGTSMVMDFKYSNSVENYKKSGQLHLYKYYLDHAGYNVTKLTYLFIPKSGIRQNNNEDLYDFRKRIVKTVTPLEINPVTVGYDEMEVIYFQNTIKEIESATEYPKNPNHDCFACNPRFAPEYLDALQKGEELMPIPKNERRTKKADLMPDTWLYGDSYVGKTVFWDSFPDVLMLNTDGNTDNTTSPFDLIKDTVTKEGRLTKRRYAWEQFLDDVTELEAGETNGFKTVVIDLVEDLYEQCRQYVLNKNGWDHEADGSYGKGWSMVTQEFHNAIKRLKAIGLQVVYISREDRKDITLKNGITRTTFGPNVSAKVANFLTGTVDITMRAYVSDDDKHVLQLQKAPNTFGGGRYEFKVAEVPLEKDEFLEALKDAQPVGSDRDKKAKVVTAKFDESDSEPAEKAEEKPARKRRRKAKSDDTPAEMDEQTPFKEPVETVVDEDDDITPPGEDDSDDEPVEKPKRRARKKRAEAKTEPAEPVEEPKPTRRRRRRRTED